MIIKPPNDDGIDIPHQFDELNEFTKEQYEYIKQRLSMPTWICISCGLTNHHYNKRCANFRCNKEKP